MHRLDRADVQAARRRGDDQHPRSAENSRAEHHLLQVAARQLTRRGRRARSLDVVAADQLERAVADRAETQERAVRDAAAR